MSRPLPDLRDLIGVPFVDRGRDPLTGLDCWGLVMEVHRRLGNEIEDLALGTSAHDAESSNFQAKRAIEFKIWRRVEIPELGDVVAMALEPELPDCIGHFGVYLEDGKFLHTLAGHEAVVTKVSDHFYKNKIRGFYRWDR